eukprot:2762521-Rhodomonas_salina.1
MLCAECCGNMGVFLANTKSLEEENLGLFELPNNERPGTHDSMVVPRVLLDINQAGSEVGRRTIRAYIEKLEYNKRIAGYDENMERYIKIEDTIDALKSELRNIPQEQWAYNGPVTEKGMNQITNKLLTWNAQREHNFWEEVMGEEDAEDIAEMFVLSDYSGDPEMGQAT